MAEPESPAQDQDINPNLSISSSPWYVSAMEQLVDVVQQLSHARDLGTVTQIVRQAARSLTGADGATFILRDNDKCFYLDEDAISPLWKGQRFPLETCISGWVMLNKQAAIIEDIYKDPRIPVNAYKPTFVKSLAMVPIRQEAPIGAIGNYWATRHQPTQEECAILQALANVTSVTMENIDLYDQLKQKVGELTEKNEELATYTWAAAHDLKTPLRGAGQLTDLIEEELKNNDTAQLEELVPALKKRITCMERLLESIFEYSRIENTNAATKDECATGDVIAKDVLSLIDLPSGFTLEFTDAFQNVSVPRGTIGRILFNLVENGIKHHDRDKGRIVVDAVDRNWEYTFTATDDGPGIPPEYQDKVFQMFQTLRPKDVVEGSGMGLPLVRRILRRHGGRIHVESGPGRGSVFSFTWPK